MTFVRSDILPRKTTGHSRRAVFVVIAMSVFATTASLAHTLPTPPRVLFVCQYGTAKSAIARELFRRRALERGIAITAISRGITPDEHVSPALAQRLKADGIDSTRDGLHKLEPSDLRAADIIVAFNTLPRAFGSVHALNWTTVPSVNDAYPAARADIDYRIDALLDVIARKRAR